MEGYLGEIRMVAYPFAPRGWAFCEGQVIAIAQNQALFSLIGAHYGGDGRTTFALPDFRGRVPLSSGQGPGLSPYNLGMKGGVETVTLKVDEMPVHNHGAELTVASSLDVSTADATTNTPDANTCLAQGQAVEGRGTIGTANIYGTEANSTMNSVSTTGSVIVGDNGQGQGHTNMQPYLAVNYIICVQGQFPTRS